MNTSAIEAAGRAARDEIFEAFKRYLARMIVTQPAADRRMRTAVFVFMLEEAIEELNNGGKYWSEAQIKALASGEEAQRAGRDIEAMIALLRAGEGL